MKRMRRVVLERKLEQARRLALEPTDPLTRERLAQIIEELEFQLQDQLRRAISGVTPDLSVEPDYGRGHQRAQAGSRSISNNLGLTLI